ncbi:MAG: MFS transporter [Dehalococcoidia bacterium]
MGDRNGDAAHPPAGWRQTFSSLSGNRDFGLLFIGNIGFFFGMQTMIIMRGWLVVEKWENAAYLGYIMGVVAIPMLVLAPVGGVIADRVDKRKLMLVGQASLVGTNAIISALILTGTIEFWHLLAVSFISGSAFALNMPSRQALVAMLVPREKLMNAIALTTAGMNASRIIAPPLGGVMIATMGLGPSFVVSTGFYACAFVTTMALPEMPPERDREFSFVQDFTNGISYMRRTPLLLGLLLFATVPMMFALPYQTLLPLFAEDVWHVGEVGFGALQGVGGVGGLIGALIVANLDSYPRKSRLLLGGSIAFGACLLLFAVAPWFTLALVFMIGIGFTSMLVMTVNNTAIQMIIPDEMRGRVMSVMMMTFGLMPLGAVPASIAADSVGVAPVVAVGAGLFMTSVLAIFAFIPSFRSLDRELQDGRERETARRAGWEGAPTGKPVSAPVANRR